MIGLGRGPRRVAVFPEPGSRTLCRIGGGLGVLLGDDGLLHLLLQRLERLHCLLRLVSIGVRLEVLGGRRGGQDGGVRLQEAVCAVLRRRRRRLLRSRDALIMALHREG